MPIIVVRTGLFGTPEERSEYEQSVLYMLEPLIDRSCRFLGAHPETPKLYDSGVRYELPKQMTNRLSERSLARIAAFARAEGADEDAVKMADAVYRGCEVFSDVETLYEKQAGDCDQLAVARCAELRRAGVHAKPYITWRETPDGTTYHCIVKWPDGSSEDPSVLLGMREHRVGDRAKEKRKNAERHDTYCEVATHMIGAGEMSVAEAAARVDSLGLLPRAGWPC